MHGGQAWPLNLGETQESEKLTILMLEQYTNFTIISTGVFRLTYLERSHGNGMTEISNGTVIQLHTEPD